MKTSLRRNHIYRGKYDFRKGIFITTKSIFSKHINSCFVKVMYDLVKRMGLLCQIEEIYLYGHKGLDLDLGSRDRNREPRGNRENYSRSPLTKGHTRLSET